MIKYSNNDVIVAPDGKWLDFGTDPGPTPPEPPVLPNDTIRVRFASGYTPTMGDSQTLVDSSNNVWDIYKASNTFLGWNSMFMYNTYLLEVLGANSSNVPLMTGMFHECTNLTSVAFLDTSSTTDTARMFESCTSLTSIPQLVTNNVLSTERMFKGCTSLVSVPDMETPAVTDMQGMFAGCTSLETAPSLNLVNVYNINSMFRNCSSLKAIPLYDVSKVTQANSTFYSCINVESGALNMYNALVNNGLTVSHGTATFRDCGSNTVTGAAELAQIPSSWGGTGA